jgi:hypothetical protein
MTGKVGKNEIEDLPRGIKLLRKFKVSKSGVIRRKTFDKIVEILKRCAGDQNPRTLKCYRCRYREECRERFDYLCGKVLEYRVHKGAKNGLSEARE